MAKRKINAAMVLAAGKDAHLHVNSKVSQAKLIDGEEFIEIDVDSIESNPMQPRIHIQSEELDELMRSIKLHGLIQPISVIRVRENKFILKAGQRRWLAHKKLGIKTIKAIVQEEKILPKSEYDKMLFEIAIMENIQRDNLNPLEFALSIRNALDKKLYKNIDDIALAVGKSKSYISKVLKVMLLNDEIIDDLSKNKSTNDIESLYEIQKITDIKEQSRVYFDFIAKKIDRSDIRKMLKSNIPNKSPQKSYTFNLSKKKLDIKIDLSKLSQENKKRLKAELEEIIKRYV